MLSLLEEPERKRGRKARYGRSGIESVRDGKRSVTSGKMWMFLLSAGEAVGMGGMKGEEKLKALPTLRLIQSSACQISFFNPERFNAS